MSEPGRPQLAPALDDGPDRLRRLFRRHAAGVAVVTTAVEQGPVGLLVTSLSSVSAAPPLLSFNVSLGSSSWPALQRVEHLGIHVLAAGQIELADRFARKDVDRFASPTVWQPGPHGVPLLAGAAAHAVTRIRDRFPAGDHVIVVAEVLAVAVDEGERPLVHHDGAFHHPVLASGHPTSARNGANGRLSVVRRD
jgi:flavin reductase (DIM6/NTAB) family NADH-FMN oxidoreductase RutF